MTHTGRDCLCVLDDDYSVKLHIRSTDRDRTLYPNPNNFRVHLLKPINQVRSITLGWAKIPQITQSDPYPYVVIASNDLYLQGLTFPQQMQQYPVGTFGVVFNNKPSARFLEYSDVGNGATWKAESPGRIARLQEFDISLMVTGVMNGPPIHYPLVPYAMPDTYPEWECVLKMRVGR